MFRNAGKRMKKLGIAALVLAQLASVGIILPVTAGATSITREVENLDRGVVAVKVDGGVFVSWRRLGTEPADTNFALYRDNQLVTSGAITNYVDAGGTLDSVYKVVTNNATVSKDTKVWEHQYIDIPLQDTPIQDSDPVVDSSGVYYPEYKPNDCSVGDLDGDGEYEIVLKWDPADAKDSSITGFTGLVYIDAYKLDGTKLWRINMGKNIRAGAHDTQLAVADFNGDGKSEVILRTADGTVAGDGTVIGDANADWASQDNGKNLKGPLYLTAFDGATGAVIDTTDYDPQTGDVAYWGDYYGGRSERYLATIAWLDGVRPSAIVQRGYYPGKEGGPGRTVVAAYNLEGGKLVKKWRFDTMDSGNDKYIGQGDHGMTAGDVDGDGYDEIISGALALDQDGSVLWCTGYGHGDAHHLGDFDPTNEGYEYLKVYEGAVDTPGFMGARNQTWGLTVQDAKTGKVLISHDGIKDTGRGMIANIGYKDKYYVAWGAGSTGYWASDDTDCGDLGLSMNGRIYWDGGLTDQLQDHVTISKWNGSTNKMEPIFTAEGCNSINGSKGNWCIQGDLFGDWREEFVAYTVTDSKTEEVPVTIQGAKGPVETKAKRTTSQYALRVYTTVIPTEYNFSTLMHDDLYRIGVATYNVEYNQPPHVSFYVSDTIDGYKTQPQPNVKLVSNSFTEAAFDPNSVSGTAAPSTPSTTPTPGASTDVKTFSDIQAHWAKDDIEAMAKAGVIDGMGDGTFAPDANITRGQFIKLIVAALGLDISADYTGSASDVSGHWAAPYVQAADSQNLIDAAFSADGKMKLDQNITREEMASIIARAAKSKNLEASAEATSFEDSNTISAWAAEDVTLATKLGIIKGMETDNGLCFKPVDLSNRAQAAAMMNRLFAMIK